jgi:hypothetical protein
MDRGLWFRTAHRRIAGSFDPSRTWYSNSLRMLEEGDRIWVKIPGKGFVGVGRVSGPRVTANDFRIGGGPALDKLQGGYQPCRNSREP